MPSRHPLPLLHSHLHAHYITGRAAPADPQPVPHPLDMPPRYAQALPPGRHGSVGDFGTLLNYTTAAEPYTHGLDGVDQTGNWLFVNVLVFSFVGLCLATLFYRWSKMGNAHVRHLLTMGGQEQQRYWAQNRTKWWPKIKRYLLYAPLFRQRHNREFQLSSAVNVGTLPGRFHTLLLVVYVSCNIAYCMVLNWNRGNSTSVLAELRGRSGVLAALNIIPTVLFALRNNPLIPILRVSYDTFNLLHRWTARMVVLEAIIHTLCWAVASVQAGGMHQLNVTLSTSVSYQWGAVATCVFTFIVLTAWSPIRHAFYETFLNLHRLLVFLGIMGVYVHLDKANLPQLPYVQLALVFWGTELAIRTVKIVFYNVSARTGFTKVTVEALPAEACRVTFELRRPWSFRPGCHVHAYLPTLALWSSHPFSIAWAENRPRAEPLEVEMEKLPRYNPSTGATHAYRASTAPRQSTLNQQQRSRASTYVSKLDDRKFPSTTAAVAQISTETVPGQTTVTSVSLVMRARTGMTRQLYNRASNTPTGSFTTYGALEGPYGGHESLASYGTVVLFAGGVGITHCIGHLQHLVAQYGQGTCATRRILLVWSVPNTEALEWVKLWMDQVLRMEHRRAVLRIKLFVTKPRHRAEVVSNTGSVQMFPGRCNPQTIVDQEVADRVGAMAVTVCGPGAFADSVRHAVRNTVETGSVDFVEEAFTY